MSVRAHFGQKARMTSLFIAARTALSPAPRPEDEDGALIHRVAAQQDRQAFETLYHRYTPRLARYLAKLLRQRELVEEVCNDTMLVVWQHAARFNHTSRLSTWIFSIAHHKALKALARAAPHGPQGALARPDAGIDWDGPEGALTRQERQHLLVRALETLPPEQRAVVELTLSHGYSYQEIAAIMGCPVNTVKTRMFHARQRLAQLVAVQEGRDLRARQEEPA
jgi:RNA polymerase sigma factor (sigma-70 family)